MLGKEKVCLVHAIGIFPLRTRTRLGVSTKDLSAQVFAYFVVSYVDYLQQRLGPRHRGVRACAYFECNLEHVACLHPLSHLDSNINKTSRWGYFDTFLYRSQIPQ